METHKEEWEKQLPNNDWEIGTYKGESLYLKSQVLHLLTHQKQTIMDMCDEMMYPQEEIADFNNDPLHPIRAYKMGVNDKLTELKERISKL